MKRPQSLHPLLAGLFATIAGSFLGAFLLAITGFSGGPVSLTQILGTTAAMGIYGALLALPVVLAYGMPSFALLGRLHLANTATAVIFGALPGFVWVFWTNGSWIDPILWNGTLIALFYLWFRRLRVAV